MKFGTNLNPEIPVSKRKKMAAQSAAEGMGRSSKREERMDQRSTNLTAARLRLRITARIDSDQTPRIFKLS
jgi:hypothetical protein